MNLSIVIVNWNTRNLLAQCLGSIFTNPPNSEFEVIVVDNGSSDASASMVRERFSQVHLIENTENLGFARANNQGIPECQGKYLMLLNSDTIVKRDALEHMVEFLDKHPDAGIVGAFLENPDGTPQRCFGSFPTVLSESAYAWGLDSWPPISKWLASYSVVSDEYCQTDWVLGAALMIRRSVLDQVGYLDEAYFMYSEEVDLCYRVKSRGWLNYVLGSAHIVHLGGESSQQTPALMKAELFRSKTKYFWKHHGRLVSLLMYFIFASSILGRRLVYYLRGRRQKADIWVDVWKNFTHKEQKDPVPN